jgi:predicted helicase
MLHRLRQSRTLHTLTAGPKFGVHFKQQVHKVQFLDVATGTGTFLAEVVKQIYARFKNQKGAWSSYVDQHLLPRMHGFELLMAPYAMCHMKLELLLKETGYTPSNPANPPRVSVYLTNSLEEYHPDTGTLFAQWLSKEANAASRIKKDIPIMVALGNPPYSRISSNMNSWIAKAKIEDYKYVDGVHFHERKHWLNDDYVQFVRLGEYYIEKNGEGILAYITNHGYLDNPTFRGMRWHLLNTFDDIYVLDLHGNANKKETAPDGSPDKNVFDIQQGVAIIVAIKEHQKGKSKPLAKVHHAELWGSREHKYSVLDEGNLKSIKYKTLDVREPLYLFIPQTYNKSDEYKNGFYIPSLFAVNSTGVQTGSEERLTGLNALELSEKLADVDEDMLKQYTHKAFDNRWMLYLEKKPSSAFNAINIPSSYRSRDAVSRHMFAGKNVALICGRSNKSGRIDHFFCSSLFSEVKCGESTTGSVFFPLYRYDNDLVNTETKTPNIDPKIYKAIQETVPDLLAQSLFDYIYAVLHSRAYRQRYAEFLKSDFPRIPYPKDKKTFHALAAKGAELRGLHLMESPALDDFITTYPIGGTHEVASPRWEDAKVKSGLGRVWINSTQYFDNVPLAAWEFYIGGYQPAQKWLKDRKGRKLTSDDLLHWQRIIVALAQTDRVMSEIDKIDFLPD